MVKKVVKKTSQTKAVKTKKCDTPAMSRDDSARYMSEMLSCLRQLAIKQNMTFLVYLLDMACMEAANQTAVRK